MCDDSDFAVSAVLGQRKEDHAALKHLIAKKDTNARLLRWILILQELDIIIKDKKGVKNVVADHLSRLTFEDNSNTLPIRDEFPDENLFIISSLPWFANIANYLATVVDYVSKWLEAVSCRANYNKTVVKFLKENILSQFGTPHVIISNRGTHFHNCSFEALMKKYGVIHKIFTSYHPRTSRQVELANRKIKQIFEKTVNPNRKDWSLRLNDALWAYRTAFKTSLEGGKHRKFQLSELEESRNDAYESSRIYKSKMKAFHDKNIVRKTFEQNQKVYLYDSRLYKHWGKLRSRWTGPFVVTRVFENGTVEIEDPNDGRVFKVNGQRLKILYGQQELMLFMKVWMLRHLLNLLAHTSLVPNPNHITTLYIDYFDSKYDCGKKVMNFHLTLHKEKIALNTSIPVSCGAELSARDIINVACVRVGDKMAMT
ncbi:uncharacterized protein LOC111412560 [Olea europaea var. sylvestris]|uniref:uncharacterized protein LOC111412560 n=1 Tax=Olea europaea var. sylvestris TaxID=158386 RepID=UPI000C1D60BC|nr:uncharacterized protein LOC111412560 [Olea europaea var. sylvestris]